MRNFLYWFMGDRAGRVIIASWNWLWGQPVQQGGKLSVEVAQAAISLLPNGRGCQSGRRL
jgi:phage shock protein A